MTTPVFEVRDKRRKRTCFDCGEGCKHVSDGTDEVCCLCIEFRPGDDWIAHICEPCADRDYEQAYGGAA